MKKNIWIRLLPLTFFFLLAIFEMFEANSYKQKYWDSQDQQIELLKLTNAVTDELGRMQKLSGIPISDKYITAFNEWKARQNSE